MSGKRKTLDEMKMERDGSLHPRLPGHTYEGEKCSKCAGRRTFRQPGGYIWKCRDCEHWFIVVAGDAAADLGVVDGTSLTVGGEIPS